MHSLWRELHGNQTSSSCASRSSGVKSGRDAQKSSSACYQSCIKTHHAVLMSLPSICHGYSTRAHSLDDNSLKLHPWMAEGLFHKQWRRWLHISYCFRSAEQHACCCRSGRMNCPSLKSAGGSSQTHPDITLTSTTGSGNVKLNSRSKVVQL